MTSTSRPGRDPRPGDAYASEAIEQVVVARTSDIGGFAVRRALPSAGRRMVGPFIFMDQMGPADLVIGEGIDVAPHPHIGLSTVTYLFDGALDHRDSTGIQQSILPGDVNWMVAGRGIVHSERWGAEARANASKLYGMQTWVALPAEHEEDQPGFFHHGGAELPEFDDGGARVRVIAGALYGESAPVQTLSELFYAEALLQRGARLPVDAGHEERAVFVVSGEVDVSGDRFVARQLLVLRPGDALTLEAVAESRVMLLGGAPMDGPRHIWWDFVSSSKERIEQAKEDWKQARFDTVPGDDGFVPLPG